MFHRAPIDCFQNLLGNSRMHRCPFQTQVFLRVHRDADAAVQQQLQLWSHCRNGSLELCRHLDEGAMAPMAPSIESNTGSSTVPWGVGKMGKRQFLAVEQEIWEADSGQREVFFWCVCPTLLFCCWGLCFGSISISIVFSACMKQAIGMHLKISEGQSLKISQGQSCGHCNLLQSERKVYSQYGVDGVLEELYRLESV